MEVTVDGDAEGEAGTEQGQAQTQTVTFTKHTYTVVYAEIPILQTMYSILQTSRKNLPKTMPKT